MAGAKKGEAQPDESRRGTLSANNECLQGYQSHDLRVDVHYKASNSPVGVQPAGKTLRPALDSTVARKKANTLSGDADRGGGGFEGVLRCDLLNAKLGDDRPAQKWTDFSMADMAGGKTKIQTEPLTAGTYGIARYNRDLISAISTMIPVALHYYTDVSRNQIFVAVSGGIPLWRQRTVSRSFLGKQDPNCRCRTDTDGHPVWNS